MAGLVELAEELGAPESGESEEEEKVFEGEKVVVVALGEVVIDEF